MNRKKRLVAVIAVVTLLVVILGGVAIAGTQTQAGSGKVNFYQDFVAKLAANLGVDQSKVTTALDATKKQMLDEAVQSGKITQQQADKIAARPGVFGCLGGFHGKGPKGHFGKGLGPMSGQMAQVLGITKDQLQSELKSGKKLSQIVTEHGLTMDQFSQKLLEAEKAALDKAVSDGKLTREKADKMLSRMTSMEKRFADSMFQGDNNSAPVPQTAE